MTTNRAYTTIEQSKKLAEILPLESADMWYQYTGISIKDGSKKPIYFPMVIRDCESDEDVPCWSLAALLMILPNYQLQTQDDGIGILCSCNGKFNIVTADNPIDACVAMILKLKENNLL